MGSISLKNNRILSECKEIMKSMKNNDEKVFLIINSYLIGDMLLVNSLVQNIKNIYKNSKIVMLSSPKLIDVVKYQKDVDEVIVWDRHGKHKGFWGMLKFIKEFPYKKIYASFPIYAMDRPVLLSRLLGAKYVLFGYKKNIYKHLLKTKYKFDYILSEEIPIQYWHVNLLKGITKEELTDYPIVYNVDGSTKNPVSESEYLVLCPISSRKSKDMPLDTVKNILGQTDKNVVILGAGKATRELSEELKKENFENLTDLIDKTSIQEAACVMKNSKGVIAVDTGLMHLACAVNKEVVCVFYERKKSEFMPDPTIYKSKVITDNQTAETILNEMNILINKQI